VLPRWIYLPAAIGALFVVVPLIAIAAKVNWPNFWSLISSESSTTALVLSLKTSAASTAWGHAERDESRTVSAS